MRRISVIACAALLGACAGSPDTAQAPAADSASGNTVAAADVSGSKKSKSNAASDDVGLQCKRVKETGTRFSYKVCTTREQREAAAAAAANSARDWSIRNQQAGGPLEGG